MLAQTFLYLFQSDTSELVKGEKDAENQSNKLDKKLKEVDDTAGGIGSSFTDLIASAGGALTALLSFGALAAGIAETSKYVDNLQKTADLYGENANQLAAYQELVVKSGGDIGSFQGVVKKLNGDFNEFVTTGNTGILPFMQRLGIDMVDADGKARGVLDTLPELADEFSKMSKAESAGIGEKLGLDEATITLLQEGRAEVEAQVLAQRELFSITDEQSKAFTDFNDSMSDTKTAFRGLFVAIGAEILPVIQYFMERLSSGISFLAKHKNLVTGIFIALGVSLTAYALPAMISFGVATVTAFAPFYAIGAVIAGVAVTVGLLYEDIMSFLSGGESAFKSLLEWIGLSGDQIETVRRIFIDLGESISNVFGFITSVLGTFFSTAVDVAKGVLSAFMPLINFFGSVLMIPIKAVINAIDSIVGLVKSVSSAIGWVADKLGLGSSDEAEKETKNIVSKPQNNMPDPSQEEIQRFQKMMSFQMNSPLNSTSPNMMSNSNMQRSSNSNIKIDKIDVNTQATDTETISREIGDSLSTQLKRTTATFEDGIEA